MEQLDQLQTIAEISVALAGFAGIIATFRAGKVSRGRVLALSMIVNISLFAAFFAVLPIGLANLGLAEKQVWSITSFLLGIAQLVFVYFISSNSNFKSLKVGLRLLYIGMLAIAVILGFANFLNAFGLVFRQDFTAIFMTVVFNLGVVCFNFSRLLLYPLWKAVREVEKEP